MRDRDASRDLVERVLAATTADDALVTLRGGTREHLRFANNQVTTSGEDRDEVLTVTVNYGARRGTASGNPVDDEGRIAVVRAAEALALVAPEDPEHTPTPGSQTYLASAAWREPGRPDAMVAGCAEIVGRAAGRGLVAAGYAEQRRRMVAVGTRNGAFAWRRESLARASVTVRTLDGDGSGWASDAALDPEAIAWESLGRRAVDKAERSVGGTALEPGRYVTVFEPAAVAEFANLLRGSLDRRATDEGRSFLSAPGGDRLGEPLFPPWFGISSHPGDPRAPADTFTDDGLPHMPTFWVTQGAVRTLPCDRAWARQRGSGFQMPPPNWLLTGGTGTVDDLVARTERGVLVTSLWYIRSVDPRQLLHTGLTRDGVWWIEDGVVVRPLRNLRWNDSPLAVFGRAIDAGEPVRAETRVGGSNTVAPPLRTEAFHFTSASDAI